MDDFDPCTCRQSCPHGYGCVHLGSDGPDRHVYVGCPTCSPETIRAVRGAGGSWGLDLPCGDRIGVPPDQRKWRWYVSEHARACRMARAAAMPPEQRACTELTDAEREAVAARKARAVTPT